MTVKYKDNSKKYIKDLKKIHGGLPTVGADVVNTGAKVIERTYVKLLKKFTLRNRFTVGGVKVFKSRPKSRGGDFRRLKDINAVVGVKKMKGGKDHYLKDQEEGDIATGKVKGKYPLAVDKSTRPSGAHNRPIKRAQRLGNTNQIQTLKFGGKELGSKSDGFGAKRGAQRWAILYKYTGLSGGGRGNRSRGQEHLVGRYGWDLGKQFFFQGMKRGLGIFQAMGKRVKAVRFLGKSTKRIKATHKLQKATEKLTPNMMNAIFQRSAKRFLRGK